MSGHAAAQIARDAATAEKGEPWTTLSMKMCWDAVIHCQRLAGAPDPGEVSSDNHASVIGPNDPAVGTDAEMRRVPQGAFIGFFDGGRLIHAMIATGQGLAAGTKNGCIGVGKDIGWEILDLAGRLTWGDGGVAGPRRLAVHYRPM